MQHCYLLTTELIHESIRHLLRQEMVYVDSWLCSGTRALLVVVTFALRGLEERLYELLPGRSK